MMIQPTRLVKSGPWFCPRRVLSVTAVLDNRPEHVENWARRANTIVQVMTDAEVREFEMKNSWSTGIHIDENRDLYYDTPEASCITLRYPETPLRVTYFARLVSMLGTFGDEANFNGALLWLRYWNAGTSQLNKSGWRLMVSVGVLPAPSQ